MNNDTRVETLHRADGLLRERRFDMAVALETNLEETIAVLEADTNSLGRVPRRNRDRVQSLPWAAELGRELSCLARAEQAVSTDHSRIQQGPVHEENVYRREHLFLNPRDTRPRQ